MKNFKTLLSFLILSALSLSMAYGQDYHFIQGFASSSTPDGWEVKDVSYSSSESNAPNMVVTDALYCAKMKTNNDNSSWLQTPKILGVEGISFWCKVRDTEISPSLIIQSSTDGTTWTDEVTNPSELDLTNSSDFQNVTVDLDIEGEVYIRFYVSSVDAGSNSKGTITLDDIQIGKPEVPSDNASLDSIFINDGYIMSVSEQKSYSIDLYYTPEVIIGASAVDPEATVEITQAIDIFSATEAERTATISIKSKDESVTIDYSIVLNITDTLAFIDFSGSTLYDNFYSSSAGYITSTPDSKGANTLPENPASYSFVFGSILEISPLNDVASIDFQMALRKDLEGDFDITLYKYVGTDSTLLETISSTTLKTTEWKKYSIAVNESASTSFKFINSQEEANTTRIFIDDISVIKGETTGLTSSQASSGVEIYPNPAQNQLNISGIEGAFAVNVYALNGVQVLKAVNTTSIDISAVPAGCYLVKVEAENTTMVQKLIVE